MNAVGTAADVAEAATRATIADRATTNPVIHAMNRKASVRIIRAVDNPRIKARENAVLKAAAAADADAVAAGATAMIEEGRSRRVSREAARFDRAL
jgi:glycerol-3-phosphate cytidylyltransferase-like family protein